MHQEFLTFLANSFDTNSIYYFIGTFFLLLLCNFCAGSETAITSVPIYKWELVNNDKKTIWYKPVRFLLQNYQMTLSTTLIGNTIGSIFCSLCFANAMEKATGLGESSSFFFEIILSLIVLVACEYIPKSLAKKHGVAWLRFFAPLLLSLFYLFYPISWVLNKIFKAEHGITANEKEVEQLITTIENEGVIEKEEAELVHNALSFDETEIKNIMKKIENVKYIRSDMKDEEVINYLLQYQHTRIPVYDTSKNAFIGYLLTIDILGSVISSQNKNIDCFKHLKFIHEIEENETLNYALKLMQRTFQPFLSVINKKKETIGILTSEQISEAIVGEIYNEYDKLNDYRYINDFTYLVNGNFNASEFFKKAFEIVIEDKQITFDGYVKSIFKFDNEANVTNIFKNDNFEVLILKKYDGVFDYEIKNLK